MLHLIPKLNNLILNKTIYNETNSKKKNNNSVFTFNNLNNILNNIEENDFRDRYKSIAYLNSTKKWIKENNFHTFPRTKKAWINTIKSTKNLKKCYKYLNPNIYLPKIFKKEYIDNNLIVYLKEKLINYIKCFTLFNGIITDKNFDIFKNNLKFYFSIKFNLPAEEVFDILIKSNLLSINNNIVLINFQRILIQKKIKNYYEPIKRKVTFSDEITIIKKSKQ